jgi:hypothetical protein
MVEACERRILEFPLGRDAREVAKELKREGWYAWASEQRRETEERLPREADAQIGESVMRFLRLRRSAMV